MILTKQQVDRLIVGKPVQVRKLVKELDLADNEIEGFENNPIHCVFNIGTNPVKRKKYCVGRDYSVQLGRGKAGLWYCWRCRYSADYKKLNTYGCVCCYDKKRDEYWKPFRIKITGIHKERLFDISEEDAKKEGFKTKRDFIEAFQTINIQTLKKKKIKFLGQWNPEVWVLEGVKK